MKNTRKPVGAILHYSAPPVVGGVETVILAHSHLLAQAGYRHLVIAGRGSQDAMPAEAEFLSINEMDTSHEGVLELSQELEGGSVPQNFARFTRDLTEQLRPILRPLEWVMVHNVFTKHFNLALTAALVELIHEHTIQHCIAWCHDITWTSPHSRTAVHPGYPWDLLRTRLDGVTYVAVSQSRRDELAGLFGCPSEEIHVVYNGVDETSQLGLSVEGCELVGKMGLLSSDPILLMPVRVTQAKNIEFALQVLRALKTHFSNPALVITGPPDPHDSGRLQYYHSLKKQVTDLNLVGHVHFAYEYAPIGVDQPYPISSKIVGDLYRLADLVFLPSHREGFGMPVLEAGLAGVPVFCTPMPAAVEIGGKGVHFIDPDAGPLEVADTIKTWLESDPASLLKRRVRLEYTWGAVFQHGIEPLIRRTL